MSDPRRPPSYPPDQHVHLLPVAVGNSRVRLGLFHGSDLDEPASFDVHDGPGILAHARGLLENVHGVPIVLSSVNAPAAETIATALAELGEVLRIGEDVPVPIRHALDDASTLGQDRQLCALAAARRAEQATVVIDAGTAITVDFVDGEGTFHGGLIAPGLSLMLASLHEHTAALPQLAFTPPDPSRGPFGKDTPHAMTLGVLAAARGLVRHAIDTFADFYGAYPQIIATGGDCAILFENDDLVEHLVPDLQLIGILEAWKSLNDPGRDAEGLPDDPEQ